MKKNCLILIVTAIFVAVIFTGPASCEEKKGDSAKKGAIAKQVTRTKEDIITAIKKLLQKEKDILNYIPELKIQKGKEGEESYTYQGVKLEDLDKEKLERISGRINTQATIIRTDRINKQLETIRRTQQTISRPPQPPTAVRIPQTPSQVYAPPKASSPPSQTKR